jgi:hypothetical protein
MDKDLQGKSLYWRVGKAVMLLAKSKTQEVLNPLGNSGGNSGFLAWRDRPYFPIDPNLAF